MSSRKVLLVEDEFLIRLILAEALAEAGYSVTEAVTADEAAGVVAREDGFDIMLTDIQTPGRLNGIELARVVREQHPDLPVVYMTGRPDAMREAGSLGPNDAFISKPYGPSEVIRTIGRLIKN